MGSTLVSHAPRRIEPRRGGPAQRAASVALVVAAHAGLGGALLQIDAVRHQVADALPIFVSRIEEDKPRPLLPPPPPPPPPRVVRKEPTPLLTAPPAPTPEPAPFVAPPPPPEPTPPQAIEAPVPLAAPPAPPAPPAPVTIDEVAYARPPVVTYPSVARRLNETGVVIVRVLIDRNGAASQVRVHKTSGHERLDEAALAAVRGARFRPYTENGVAAPAYALIPIRFELR